MRRRGIRRGAPATVTAVLIVLGGACSKPAETVEVARTATAASIPAAGTDPRVLESPDPDAPGVTAPEASAG